MPFDPSVAIADIETALRFYNSQFQKYKKNRLNFVGDPIPNDFLIELPAKEGAELTAKLRETIRRHAPRTDYGSELLQNTDKAPYSFTIPTLAGVLETLLDDYRNGRTIPVIERIHSDMFSDFLEMAEYLIEDEGLKDPAAVLAGGVLEQHLKKLYVKHIGPLPAKATIDPINVELARANVYSKNEQKQMTAWAGIRNDAAHGDYAKYNADQVNFMIQGIRSFLQRNPA